MPRESSPDLMSAVSPKADTAVHGQTEARGTKAIIRAPKECVEIQGGDGTQIRELLHPDREPLAIRYSLAYASLERGRSSKPHIIKTCEVYVLVSGQGRMHIDDEVSDVCLGQIVYIPPGATQWIENMGEGRLEFLCIVDPAWRQEDEQVI